MKACFFLQRRFAYVGHAMVKLLQERYGITEFCGYVNLRSSYEFLRQQTEINYTNLLCEEDIYASFKDEVLDREYLTNLEKEYGLPTLWSFINMDRVLRYGLLLRAYPSDTPLYSHEDLLRITQVTAKAITRFLDEEKPNFVFFSVISNLGSMLLYHMARKRGIKTFIMYTPRVGNKQSLSEEFDTFTDLEKSASSIQSYPNDSENQHCLVLASDYLHSFQNRPTYFVEQSAARSHYGNSYALRRSHLSFMMPQTIGRSIRWFFKMNYLYFTNPRKDDYSVIKPWYHVIDKIKNKYRILRGAHDLFDSPNQTVDQYAFFALHYEPEALPMILAPFYTDQLWLVKQAAQSLPAQFKLYVKDHPQMVGRRPRSFYKELKKIPNVRLINPRVTSFDLISTCKLTLTISGTAAWEAVLLKKPVIIFGKVFYSSLSAVKVCRSILDLPALVSEQITRYQYKDAELINFMAAIYKESVDIDLIQIWDVEGGSEVLGKKYNDLIPLIDLLAKKLALTRV